MCEETIRFAPGEIFEQAALWRAMQPQLRGSGEAAKHFGRIIATVGQVERRTLLAYAELWEAEADRQAHRDLVKTVGFGFEPASASDFAARFIAERTAGVETVRP